MLIVHWLVMTASVIIVAYVMPGVTVSGFFSALWVALFLGIVNVLLRPLLILITLPINVLTLGLFTFVINGLLILLVSSVIKGFQVGGFWVAVLFSVLLSIVNFFLNSLLGTR
jgi:putative membrane protein